MLQLRSYRIKDEYINRNELYTKLHEVGGCDAPQGTWSAGYDAGIDLAIEIVTGFPATDVAEVVPSMHSNDEQCGRQ